MKFSERIGINPVDTALQVQGMNDALRNSLWNVLDVFLWNRSGFMWKRNGEPEMQKFSGMLWFHYFKKPIDSRPDNVSRMLENA